MFLDPKQPLHTCKQKSCTDCQVPGAITCHFSLKQLLHFLSIGLPPFIVGFLGLHHGLYEWKVLAIWLGIIIAFFGFIEIRVMCSHCPHYAEPSLKNLKCWANYGAPKIWKYRPGPMSKIETIVFVTCMAIVFLYPSPFLFLAKQWSFFVIHLLTVISFFATLRSCLCNQCINFACTFNAVPEKERDKFFKENPTVAKAWGKK